MFAIEVAGDGAFSCSQRPEFGNVATLSNRCQNELNGLSDLFFVIKDIDLHKGLLGDCWASLSYRVVHAGVT